MISRTTANECFVYIILPGETEFVTAGKFELTTNRQGNPTGKFVYGRTYLEPDDAKNSIDKIEETIKNRWYDIARKAGVTEKDCERIAIAFAYPGFRLEMT
jgi:serine/threonine-protein kinase HipA